ncbi:Rho Gtpase-Activating Protein 20 [Manis pentadactyla]|nr:Rho Gtpase-Activating Protein 20 [Manis pentadactyla]
MRGGRGPTRSPERAAEAVSQQPARLAAPPGALAPPPHRAAAAPSERRDAPLPPGLSRARTQPAAPVRGAQACRSRRRRRAFLTVCRRTAARGGLGPRTVMQEAVKPGSPVLMWMLPVTQGQQAPASAVHPRRLHLSSLWCPRLWPSPISSAWHSKAEVVYQKHRFPERRLWILSPQGESRPAPTPEDETVASRSCPSLLATRATEAGTLLSEVTSPMQFLQEKPTSESQGKGGLCPGERSSVTKTSLYYLY